MKKLSYFILIIFVMLQSCAPKITTNIKVKETAITKPNNPIIVIKETEKLPEKSKYIGEVKIGDTGFSTNCGYSHVLDYAKEVAQKQGANIIKLTKIREPNIISDCFRIKAKLYQNTNSKVISALLDKQTEVNKSKLPENADYAVVYFYRPKYCVGSIIGYNIKNENNNIIGRVRNGEKFKYITKDFGKHSFLATTISKTKTTINIEKGKEYYVRCGLKAGFPIEKPDVYIIENQKGSEEYNKI